MVEYLKMVLSKYAESNFSSRKRTFIKLFVRNKGKGKIREKCRVRKLSERSYC